MCYIEIIDNVLVTALIDRGCLERIREVLKPLKEAGPRTVYFTAVS